MEVFCNVETAKVVSHADAYESASSDCSYQSLNWYDIMSDGNYLIIFHYLDLILLVAKSSFDALCLLF